MNRFILGFEADKQTVKCSQAVKAHLAGENLSGEPIELIINISKPLAKESDYTPRIIPISHGIKKLSNMSILLITKDPSTSYRNTLCEEGTKTQDLFQDIFSFTKFRKICARGGKETKKLCSNYDLILIDHRLHKLIVPILAPLYTHHRKFTPFMIQMARPSMEASIIPKKHKIKDERCDPVYVYRQIKSICKNAFFIINKGTCLNIIVGNSGLSDEQIRDNVNDILQFLVDPKKLPVGGLLKRVESIQSCHLKSPDSASLPIWSRQS